MLELLEDGSKEFIVAIAISWTSTYEGKIGLINGLGKKSLCAKKGILVDWGGEGTYLQEKKRLNQYEQLKGMHKHEMKITKTYSQSIAILVLFLGGQFGSKE